MKIGDKVLISKTSKYYIDNDKSNPKNVEGIITLILINAFHLPIKVKWDTGYTNSYSIKDLELVNNSLSKIKEEKPKKRRLLIG